MSINEIKRVTSPTLFISGMADTLVPPKMTHDLYTVSVNNNENDNFWSLLSSSCTNVYPSSKSSRRYFHIEFGNLTKTANNGDEGNNNKHLTFKPNHYSQLCGSSMKRIECFESGTHNGTWQCYGYYEALNRFLAEVTLLASL